MRYRLRTLLLVMLAVALVTGAVAELSRALGRQVDRWREEQLAKAQAEIVARAESEARERESAWAKAKAKSKGLGAPQPIRSP